MRLLFETFVVQHKILNYSEFLNLEQWEISMMADALGYSEREEWERTRFLAYMTAQMQSTKRLKPTDIIKFKWDTENKNGGEKTTKEQFEEYKKIWQAQVKI